MKIYVDSADIAEIQNGLDLGLCDGVTTNPTLIARTGKSMTDAIKDICSIVDGDVHAEVLSLEADEIYKEGKEFAKIADNVVVKIPMCHEGLKAVKRFSDEGIKTNVTLIFSTSQAILAAKAGASNVCPFVGRLDDISTPGNELINEIVTVFDNYSEITSEIIVASIRNPLHVVEPALAGAHIFTVPGGVLTQMEKHPLTDIGIAAFLEDAKKFT
ncbi:MAG: fructose-6-phosphate aldolase [Gammaproteobacteria bacterium]|nr:fructose-6-phosphate aldolase [Gammaproteobacteria bacterium]MCW8923629.1 fructose-6-phosphate aldolase [Gammaproteobacteria bacterium]